MTRVAVYLRVSTAMQSVASQRLDLINHAAARGWQIVEEYTDVGISGARERRPSLDRLMADARRRLFDVVLVWRFDRFARNTRFLLESLQTFRALGVDFVSYQEALDTSTPMGEAMFSFLAALTKLEKDIIAERVRAGLRAAVARGAKLGRPRLHIDTRQLEAVIRQELPVRAAARVLGISASSYARLIHARAEGSAVETHREEAFA